MDLHRAHKSVQEFIMLDDHGCDDIAQTQQVEPQSVIYTSPWIC
jgi:hypothetical protein